MNPITAFKSSMATVVRQNTLHESNWRAESWKQPWKYLNQEVLNDAFNQHGLVRDTFSIIGELTQRKGKSIARVEKKMTEQLPGNENYFKVVCYFLAVRTHCDVKEISGKIDRIREIVLLNKGEMYIRGSSEERPYGFFMDEDKNLTDITQYVYVFTNKIGYPLEIQIGHEFASHTFTIESALRDNPSCGKVDLWSQNFYGDVKKFILDKANGIPTSQEAKANIQSKAENIHGKIVPEDLQKILSML